jgi:hypothetical protein
MILPGLQKKLKDNLFGTHTYFYGFKVIKLGKMSLLGISILLILVFS